jgi:hypothetical protein
MVSTDYEENTYSINAEIFPGMVTYLRFVGNQGFYLRPPSTPASGFIPPDQSQPPSP